MANPAMEWLLYQTCTLINSYTILTVIFSDPTACLAAYPQAKFNHKHPQKDPSTAQENKQINDYLEIGECAPDFGRFLTRMKDRDHPIKTPIDFWEVKPLYDTALDVPWWDLAYKKAAEKITQTHIPQVFRTAMAAFGQYSELDEISANLLVGIYYSRFIWKCPAPLAEVPQNQEEAREHPPVTPVPGTSNSLHSNAQLKTQIQHLDKLLAEEVVHTPTVISWCQPIFKDATHPTLSLKPYFTLSDSFTQAVFSPICN